MAPAPTAARGARRIDYRLACPEDAQACVVLRGRTRDNAIAPARLAERGITADSWARGIRDGRLVGHVAWCGHRIVGHCFGDACTGEVLVLALLPQAENQGVGKALLARVVADLQGRGFHHLFLGCTSDPSIRSHGFYRHLGWRPTGATDAQGDDILVYTAPAP